MTNKKSLYSQIVKKVVKAPSIHPGYKTVVVTPEEEKMVLVIAGDYHQAKFYARQEGWKKWRYVENTRDFDGREDFVIAWCGTHRNRSDIGRIADAADYFVRSGRARNVYAS